jgi:DNA-binding CsgD family transcriptional regulator
MPPSSPTILERLAESEISASIDVLAPAGWRARLGDDLNGWDAEELCNSYAEAAAWLDRKARELHPQSDYAGPADVRAFVQLLGGLTPRERDVFNAMVRGQTNNEIGAALGVSPRTIEVHRARVMLKLRADNFAQLVRLAVKAGL